MKVYHVRRTRSGVHCVVAGDDTAPRVLPHIPVHSPSGFEMGYAGSGPADLALAILAEHLELEPRTRMAFEGLQLDESAALAWDAHQRFKVEFIIPAKCELDLTEAQIGEWLDKHKASRLISKTDADHIAELKKTLRELNAERDFLYQTLRERGDFREVCERISQKMKQHAEQEGDGEG